MKIPLSRQKQRNAELCQVEFQPSTDDRTSTPGLSQSNCNTKTSNVSNIARSGTRVATVTLLLLLLHCRSTHWSAQIPNIAYLSDCRSQEITN